MESRLKEMFPELEEASENSLQEQIEKVQEESNELNKAFKSENLTEIRREALDVIQSALGVIYKLKRNQGFDIERGILEHQHKIKQKYAFIKG